VSVEGSRRPSGRKENVLLDRLKADVYETLLQLPASGLVQGTSGNVSGHESDRVVIKPSGVPYDKLSPSDLVVLDMDGRVLEGHLRPSVDAPAHLTIYRNAPDLGGVVHTHSVYATAFAALGRSIPVYLTELADVFGGEIAASEYVPPGDEAIGVEFASKAGSGRYRALLMKHHGVFTAGRTPGDALSAARIVEHSAMISFLAELLGQPSPLPKEEVRTLHRKFVVGYGQSEPEDGADD
jgi:L-ribulose-5-phosphate 4-epimerase